MNVVKSCSAIASLILATLPLIACGGGDDDGTNPPGEDTHYVNDTITVPQNNTQTRDLGLNIDGDMNNRPDNALGGILSALKQQGVDIQATVNNSVTSGTLVLLHNLNTGSFTSASSADWTVYLGNPTTTPPAFNGSDAFTVDPTAPTDGLLTGKITGGEFNGGPANVTIQLALTTGQPIRVALIGTRIKANVTATGCTNGVLGGAITDTELNLHVIPGIASLMNNSIKDDGPDGTTPAVCAAAGDTCPAAMNGDTTSCDVDRKICVSSTSKTVLNLFDGNKDAVITESEIKDNTLIKALLAPDVDLLDGTTFKPLTDGVKDSLSVGIGFTCKNAVFTNP